MIDAVWAEWTKLRTVRSTVWTLLVAAVTALGGSVILAVGSAGDAHPPFNPVTGTFLAWGEYPVLAVGVLGALAITGEFASGQIRTTFMSVPLRSRVLVAKAVTVGGLVLVVSGVLAWIAFGATEVALAAHHRAISLGVPGVSRSVLMAAVAMSAVALLSLGVGAIVRHTVGAVITFPAVLFLPLVLLSLPWSWGDEVGRFSLLAASYQLVSPERHAHLLPVWASLVVVLVWPAVALVGGALLLQQRDV